MPGRVVFVGAGPGSADLITLRGLDRLRQADVVLHDALIDLPALRALAPQADWQPVGKRGFAADSTPQDEINGRLVALARQHGLVARLKGGDPGLFGRLEEELLALRQHGIGCEVVPGVTAASAASAEGLRPLTRRGSGRSVTLATAMTREGDLQAHRHADTEVFYMAGLQLAALSTRLRAEGWPDDAPVHVVSRAGWPDARASDHTVTSLQDAGALHAGRPTVVVVGAGGQPLPSPCGHPAPDP